MKSPHGNATLAFAAASRLVVELSAPLDGRRINGPELAFRDGNPATAAYKTLDDRDHQTLWVVPRVLGLAPEDARRVLRAQGFSAELSGEGTRIVSQHPEPDQVAPGQHGPFHGTVTLVAGN